MTLILVGYMGSGKSSVGKKLSKVLNYDFVDLDTYIEDHLGMKVRDIFKHKGEIYFRKQESKFLKEVIKNKHHVIALGGGTPCYGYNLDVLKNQNELKIIYLKSSIKNLSERLFSEKKDRPLISHLNTETDLFEFIGKHLFERAPFYEQADITVKTDLLTIDQVVASILLELF